MNHFLIAIDCHDYKSLKAMIFIKLFFAYRSKENWLSGFLENKVRLYASASRARMMNCRDSGRHLPQIQLYIIDLLSLS